MENKKYEISINPNGNPLVYDGKPYTYIANGDEGMGLEGTVLFDLIDAYFEKEF